MIKEGNRPNQAVYDLQTIYLKLGEDIGQFKNMLDPTVRDGRDGKYGTTCIGITKKLRAKYGLPPADYVDSDLFGKLGLALMAIPSGITQAELDAEKARTAAAVAETAKVNQKLTDTNNRLIAEQSISQNWAADASAKKSQDEFNERNNGYLDRYSKAMDRISEIDDLKKLRKTKNLILDGFIRKIVSRPLVIDEFDDRLWVVAVDRVTVMADGKLTFKFKDGSEIKS